ncbi:DUF3376 domain-containing protein [Agromyces sp. SYSU T0242]|uniref:DUF3376 domain-containing protein n=1 Tax=Agromyces litoreus TaxID=3158561 RepID=UPI003396983D
MIRTGSPVASAPVEPVTTTGRPVRVVVVGADERVADVLRRLPGATPSFNRTLRVALAMRGGVSLAVWIGGTVAELDLLRRIRLVDHRDETLALVPETAERPLTDAVRARLQAYAEMLDAAGYDRVEFDLLAGASAGGLNAVVYSVAQRAGTGLDRLLHTWGRVGGFWGLLHPPGARRILALMQGEDYFRAQTFRALTEIYASDDRHPDLVADYTSVDLSATVIDAADEFEEDANEGRGHFRFVGSARHRLDNRIPSRTGDPDERADDLENLSRLALAARSTSSLPGGFEPALVDSTAGPAASELDDDEPTTSAAAGMRFAFAAHREADDAPYRVVDGAVFDNVPIERALRAARSRVSDRRADRAMIFLDPEPDPPVGGTTAWDPDASRFFRAIGAMLQRQFRSESVSREVAELERFNAAQQVATARFHSAAPLVASVPWTAAAIEDRRTAYLRGLAVELADHLAETISGPSIWQLHTELPSRRRYRPVPLIRLTGLADAASRRFQALTSAERRSMLASPLALADAANCTLGWVRALEALPAEEGSRHGLVLPEVRAAAYAALTAATAWRDELTAGVLELTDAFARSGGGEPGPEELDAWIERWVAASRRLRTGEHWLALDQAVARLRVTAKGVERDAVSKRRTLTPEWETSAWRPLSTSPQMSAGDLPPLFHSAGIPPALSDVRYWPISVDEAPAAPGEFSSLVEDRWYAALGRVVRSPALAPAEAAEVLEAAAATPALDRASKLAGYGFGNFLGFLARDWRVNDWWWGRLDGAAGVARFLTSLAPGRVRTDLAVHRLQDAVLAEADEPAVRAADLSPLEEPRSDGPRSGAEGGTDADADREAIARRARMRAGTDTLFDLSPSYRFSIASRTVRLLDRVVVQPTNRVTTVLAQAGLALLRPLLVVVPTLFDPPRLALVSGFVAAVAWLLTWDDVELGSPGWFVVAGVSAAAAIVAVLAAVVVRLRRWAAIVDELAGPERSRARAALDRASRRAWFMAWVAVAAVVPFSIALLSGNVLLFFLCLGVIVVLGGIAARLATTATRAPVPGREPRAIAMMSVFAVFGGLLPATQLLVELIAGDPLPTWLEVPREANWIVLAAGAVAVGVTLTVDWLRVVYAPPLEGGRRPRIAWHRRVNLVNWITVTLAATAAGLGAWWVASVLTDGVASVIADAIAAGAFTVAWANVLWWVPDALTRLPGTADRVERAPLD